MITSSVKMPDLVYVLLNRTVGCRLSAACHVEHCHLASALRRGMLPLRALSFCVGFEVCQDEVRIYAFAAVRVQQRIIDLAEHFHISV